MEMEEMKKIWANMSEQIEKQKKLTDSLVMQMAAAGYKNKLGSILIPELVGSVICFVSVLLIVFNFQKLDTWYLQVCGFVSVVILLLLPVLSLHAFYKMRNINIAGNSYKQSLADCSKARLRLIRVQKLSFYFSAVLMLIILPVSCSIVGKPDIFKSQKLWLWYAVGYIIFFPFARWAFKKYSKISQTAENILKQVEA
jgi:hypothetical protein